MMHYCTQKLQLLSRAVDEKINIQATNIFPTQTLLASCSLLFSVVSYSLASAAAFLSTLAFAGTTFCGLFALRIGRAGSGLVLPPWLCGAGGYRLPQTRKSQVGGGYTPISQPPRRRKQKPRTALVDGERCYTRDKRTANSS